MVERRQHGMIAGGAAACSSTSNSTIYSLRAPDVIVNAKARKRMRVVTISDTHEKHWMMTPKVPDGDLLIHAGDFCTKLRREEAEGALRDFNEWLGTLPHRHKIVICGNHETPVERFRVDETQRLLSNAIYLQDSATTVEGIRIWGSPWNSSRNMGFSKRAMELERVWDAIPDGTDIVVTHQPPYNMHDLAYEPSNARAKVAKVCNVCGEMHRRYTHWGNWSLRNRVAQVGAKVHIFGHVHDSHGFTAKDGTLFINAAQDNVVQPIFFDLLV